MRWRPVSDVPDYEVSDDGRVRSHKNKSKGAILAQTTNQHGYKVVSLYVNSSTKKSFSVHRLVAKAFLPNPSGLPEVAHKNNKRGDNRVSNLRWSTTGDNERDKTVHGTNKHLQGSTNGNASLSDKQITEIRTKYATKRYRQVDLAKEYGVSQVQISRIVTGRGWKHL